jgi:MSHA pilin protein MshC
MCKVKQPRLHHLQAQQGFTLVELVTVVIVLGILALSVAPKFVGPSGFTEYALQKRIVASLRNIQQKSMYDTRSSFCYQLNVVTGSATSAAFGPSTASYTNGNETASCSTTIDNTSASFLRTQGSEISDNGLSFSATDGSSPITYIRFDNMGRPLTSAGTCATGCSLTFSGQSAATTCISDQGFVHACNS